MKRRAEVDHIDIPFLQKRIRTLCDETVEFLASAGFEVVGTDFDDACQCSPSAREHRLKPALPK